MAIAVVIGTGGIGHALEAVLVESSRYDSVLAFSRSSDPAIELTDRASIARAAAHAAKHDDLRLVIAATGFLSNDTFTPEKSWDALDPAHLARAFAINATGPALLMKHFLPLLPRKGRAVFATLSARVGSIGDNSTGGWYAYRASKAALNQILRTASVELARRRPDALCVAVHPGTVDTGLSALFAKQGLDVLTPRAAAEAIVAMLETLDRAASGTFVDRHGAPIPW